MSLDCLPQIILDVIGVIKRLSVLSFVSFVFFCLYLFIPFVFVLALVFFLLYQWCLLFLSVLRLKRNYVNFKKTLDN